MRKARYLINYKGLFRFFDQVAVNSIIQKNENPDKSNFSTYVLHHNV